MDLYHAITDCGAGGFSSAVGEMGEKIGAACRSRQVPAQVSRLSYTEIWISEAQERMILAVPPANWERLEMLCAARKSRRPSSAPSRLPVNCDSFIRANQVGDLDMHFLHDGRPPVVRQATCKMTVALNPQESLRRTCGLPRRHC